MAHQQNYNSVPPSQQQQQPTGQPNHNQQPPGAGPQRHHPNYAYATQAAQARQPQPGAGSHANQQGQRILQQYSQQGNNPHTQNYIPGVSL